MTQKNSSVSIIMPALDEEENIEAAVNTVRPVLEDSFKDWEILIFNDGSTDKTGEIAERLSKEDPRVKVTHHEKPKNLGGVYKAGIQLASKEFMIMIPGDNENGSDTLVDIFKLAGQADMIVPYVVNTNVRPLKRRLISKTFVLLTNLVSGTRLNYYNGTVLHKTELLKAMDIKTDSFGYSAEIIVRLIRRGYSFKEVGIELAQRPKGESKALKAGNFVQVARFLVGLAKRDESDKKRSLHQFA